MQHDNEVVQPAHPHPLHPDVPSDSSIPARSPQENRGDPSSLAIVVSRQQGDSQRKQRSWNLCALMLDVTCFSLGMAFLDQNAVLPLLLSRLGATGALIGAFAALRFLVFSLFQILVSYAMHGKRRQKPWLAIVATVTRLPLLALPFFLWNAHDAPSRELALVFLIVLMSLWALGDGLGYVPWMEIVARAFTDRTRGRFFASSQLVSGIASVCIAAFTVSPILHSSFFPFPHNYAVLAGVAAIMFQISLVGVLLIREPMAPPHDTEMEQIPPLADYVRRLPSLIRANPIFARLACIQLLIGFGAASAPFYVLDATRHFRLGDAWGGTFQVMQALGMMALMPAWAYLSERHSPATSVRGVALACCLTPLIAMTIGRLNPWIYGLSFLIMGGSLNWGLWISLNHYLLAHLEAKDRSVYVALLIFLFVPSALFPYLGGLLVRRDHLIALGSTPILLILTTVVTFVGLLLSLSLPPPGREQSAGRS